MNMKIFKIGDQPEIVGIGYLYAMPVKDFKVGETTYAEMKEVGYLGEDGATFRRTGESTPLVSGSHGRIHSFVSGYETEFETSTISLTKENLTLFTTGSEAVENEDGTVTIYGCEDDEPANLALCYRGEYRGSIIELYMPNAIWVPELEMVFDNENPVALGMKFTCCNTTLGNGKQGSYYINGNIFNDTIE